MKLSVMQQILEARFVDDYARLARMRHFMALLRSAADGMAGIGIVLEINAEGLDESEASLEAPAAVSSLAEAISLMRKGEV